MSLTQTASARWAFSSPYVTSPPAARSPDFRRFVRQGLLDDGSRPFIRLAQVALEDLIKNFGAERYGLLFFECVNQLRQDVPARQAQTLQDLLTLVATRRGKPCDEPLRPVGPKPQPDSAYEKEKDAKDYTSYHEETFHIGYLTS